MAQRGFVTIAYPNGVVLRLVSLSLAIALSMLLLVYPRAVADSVSEVRHGLLVLMMWGCAAGFVHGVGFVPRFALWRLAFHPVTGWLLMVAGIGWIALHH